MEHAPSEWPILPFLSSCRQIIKLLFSNILINTLPEGSWHKQKKTRPSESWHTVFISIIEDENQESNPWKCGTEAKVLWYWMHSKLALCHNRVVKCQYWNSKWYIWAPDYRSSMCDPFTIRQSLCHTGPASLWARHWTRQGPRHISWTSIQTRL